MGVCHSKAPDDHAPDLHQYPPKLPQAADVESADQLLGDSTRNIIWKRPLSEADNKILYYSEKYHAKGGGKDC
jgi:hypothetical protein